jgi:energy-dependent translational throttle protein EttA
VSRAVLATESVSKQFGGLVAVDELDFELAEGTIASMIGPNGAGKTTLFRMIVGQEKPDSGTLRIGETVKLAYVDQSREALEGQRTVWEAISGGAETLTLGGRTIQSRSYVASFNFRGTDQQKRVGDLSGGERNRLQLATMLKSGANLLLLDEPTNDLDVDTLRALEDALLEFAGCAVVISHDRWFLDRIVTHILAFEDEGRVVWLEGNYADYEMDRRRRLGADAERPHRLRFKRLRRD